MKGEFKSVSNNEYKLTTKRFKMNINHYLKMNKNHLLKINNSNYHLEMNSDED